jgi:hypothetical protein
MDATSLLQGDALGLIVGHLAEGGANGRQGLASLECAAIGLRDALRASYQPTVAVRYRDAGALDSLSAWLQRHPKIGAVVVAPAPSPRGAQAAVQARPLIEAALERLLQALPLTTCALLSIQGPPPVAASAAAPPTLSLAARKHHLWKLRSLSLRCGERDSRSSGLLHSV